MRFWIRYSVAALAAVSFGLFSHLALAAPCADQAPHGAPRSLDPQPTYTHVVCKHRDDGVGFYLLRYDRDRATPVWTAHHLSRSKMLAIETLELSAQGYFAVDREVDTPDYATPRHDDYDGVGDRGLDRGHLTPNKAMSWDPAAQDATYLVSNVAAQDDGFNGGLWAKLEGNVRAWACRKGTVYVVTGVIHGRDPQPPLPWDDGPDIDVPTHFYKVVYTPHGGGRAIGFLVPNSAPGDGTTLADHIEAIDAIEAKARLDILPDLPAAEAVALESGKADPDHWPLSADSGFACTPDTLAALAR